MRYSFTLTVNSMLRRSFFYMLYKPVGCPSRFMFAICCLSHALEAWLRCYISCLAMASTTHQNLKGPDISYINVRVMICPKSQNVKAATWHLHINPIEWHIGTHTFYTNYLCTLSLDILIQPHALLTSLCQRYQPTALGLTSPWEWLNPSIVMCSCLYVDTNVLIVDNELWYSNLIPIDTPCTPSSMLYLQWTVKSISFNTIVKGTFMHIESILQPLGHATNTIDTNDIPGEPASGNNIQSF